MTIALILFALALLLSSPVWLIALGALVGAILGLNHGQSKREPVEGIIIEWNGVTRFVPNAYPETTTTALPSGGVDYAPEGAPGTSQEAETVPVGEGV